jgi:phage head maturation protease
VSYETRAYDNEHGQPVVVLVAEGTHDVSRLVNLLNSGNCEQVSLGHRVLKQVRRHNGGRAALQLLAAHGGPDFLYDGDES